MAVLALIASLLLASPAVAWIEDSYIQSVDVFSGHLYQEAVSQAEDQNVIVSGLSVESLFAMLALGASGQTRQEVLAALTLGDINAVTKSIKETNEQLNSAEGVTLSIANKLYAKPSSSGKLDSVTPSFRSQLEDIFASEVQQVDFSENVEAAGEINSWVQNKTNNRIKDLVSPDSINGLTSAVLVNAIYFKGTWQNKFNASLTQAEDFTLADGSKVKRDFLNQRDKYMFKESPELDAKILWLPYLNEEAVLVLILPTRPDGLAALEQKLANGTSQYLEYKYEALVNLKVPKFKIESTVDLKEALQKLGANRVFTTTAELEGILQGESGLYVSSAVQKAFIEVNEEGAEAAAASVLQFVTYAFRPDPPERDFFATHPFYFVLQYKEITIFTGSVKTKPEQ